MASTKLREAPADEWMRERVEAVLAETTAMHAAFVALQAIDFNARKRVLRWLAEALEDVEVPF